MTKTTPIKSIGDRQLKWRSRETPRIPHKKPVKPTKTSVEFMVKQTEGGGSRQKHLLRSEEKEEQNDLLHNMFGNSGQSVWRVSHPVGAVGLIGWWLLILLRICS